MAPKRYVRKGRTSTKPKPVEPKPPTRPKPTPAKPKNKFQPKPLGPNKGPMPKVNKTVPRSAPNLGSAAKLAARQAAGTTAKFFSPTKKAQLIAGGITTVAGAYTAATAKYKNRTGSYPWSSAAPAKKTPAKKIPGMTSSAARQEVAMTKRAQENKRAATGMPKKKVTAKQTAWRESRRWGTSENAMKLSKANRSRPRG